MDQLPHLSEVNALLRLVVGASLGVGIGLERQWRQRMAGGLQTCALVAAGATLFTVIAPLLHIEGDQTRIMANIVTGVGFLAGGVILKDGVNVRGLNTAATIWATAAVGALAGFGFWIEATCGAVVITGLNWLLSPLVDLIDHRERLNREAHFEVSVTCKEDAVASVSALVLNVVDTTELQLASRQSSPGPEPGTVVRVAELVGRRNDEKLVEDMVGRARALPGVLTTSWSVRDRA